MLRVFILGETYVEGPCLANIYNYFGNVRVRISNVPAKVPQGGTKVYQDTALEVYTNFLQPTANKLTYASSMMRLRLKLSLVKHQGRCEAPKPNDGMQYGPLMDVLGINGSANAGCKNCHACCFHLSGEWEIHPTC